MVCEFHHLGIKATSYKLVKIIFSLKMGSKQITFKEGASLNRPPLFEGEHFSFWQKGMQIFIQSIDLSGWNAIAKSSFIPTKEVNGELVPKE